MADYHEAVRRVRVAAAEVLGDDADVNESIRTHGFRPPSFEGYAEDRDALDELTRHDYARGKVNLFCMGEAEEVLTWEGISVNPDPASLRWRKLARELQAATIKATGPCACGTRARLWKRQAFPDSGQSRESRFAPNVWREENIY